MEMRVKNLQGTCESYLSRKTSNKVRLAQQQALINWKLTKERTLADQLKINWLDFGSSHNEYQGLKNEDDVLS